MDGDDDDDVDDDFSSHFLSFYDICRGCCKNLKIRILRKQFWIKRACEEALQLRTNDDIANNYGEEFFNPKCDVSDYSGAPSLTSPFPNSNFQTLVDPHFDRNTRD